MMSCWRFFHCFFGLKDSVVHCAVSLEHQLEAPGEGALIGVVFMFARLCYWICLAQASCERQRKASGGQAY